MIGRAQKISEASTLEFRGCEKSHTDVTSEDVGTRHDLERIAINQHYSAVRPDEEIAVIDVPENEPVFMDNRERPSDVCADVDQEPKVGFRKRIRATLRAVELMYVSPRDDARHHKSADFAGAFNKQVCGPRGDTKQSR